MKNKHISSGFTLIELLVVIVIIGILSTISTATFSRYFKKARDVERQSFIQNAEKIIISSQLPVDSPEYRKLINLFSPQSELPIILTEQGSSIPDTINGFTYTYIALGEDFVIAVCSEDNPSEIFEAGTIVGLGWTDCDGSGTTVDMTIPNESEFCQTQDSGSTLACESAV